MKLFDILEKKQKTRTSFYKSDEYHFYMANRLMLNSFDKFDYLINPKDEFDIMRANIILKANLNKNLLEKEMKSYETYINNGTTIDHVKLLNTLKDKMVDEPYFMEDKFKIYIPFFSRSINTLYTREPEKLLVPPYIELRSDFSDTTVDPFDTYGAELFYSTFTRLLKVGTNGKEIAYFHYDTNTIYIINKQGRLDCKIVLFDKYIKRPNYNHMLERISPVVEAYFNNDRKGLIYALHEQKLISAKLLYIIDKKGKKE